MIDKDLFNQAEQKEETINFATITGIFADGVTLRFDGEEKPTEKHYKVNSFVVFNVNDRVRIIKDSGTYVVEYSVGNPKTSFISDTATKTETSKYFTDKHTSTKIGFFNSNLSSRWQIYNISTNATLSQTSYAVNRLISALQAYGLIG